MKIPAAIAHHINNNQLLLKLAYGLLFVVAGADKFFSLIVRWEQYVNPLLLKVFPLELMHIMWFIGALELIIGLMILTKWTRFGAYVAAAWLVCIAVNLVSMGMFFDIAIRDIMMAIGAIVLADLTRVQEEI